MPRTFARHQLTVIRPGTAVDRYGQATHDWDHTSEHTIDRCVVDPLDGAETFDASGGRVAARWRAICPAGADITTVDRIRHRGEVYDVDGPVQHYDSPSGRLAHIELILKRVGD